MLKHLEVSVVKESYLWAGLNLADFILTSIALAFGAVEANFVMQYFHINTVWEIFVWKAALVIAVITILGNVEIPYAKNENILYLVNRFMICVCVWNGIVLLISAAKG